MKHRDHKHTRVDIIAPGETHRAGGRHSPKRETQATGEQEVHVKIKKTGNTKLNIKKAKGKSTKTETQGR